MFLNNTYKVPNVNILVIIEKLKYEGNPADK